MLENKEQFDDAAFDRLVDGELSADQRRDFLLSLDKRENGWRNCALAFLEAQTWGLELKSIVAKEPLAISAKRAAPPHRWRATGWLALAACLLMTFTLALALRERIPSSPPLATTPNGPNSMEQLANGEAVPGPHESESLIGQKLSDDDVLKLWVRDTQGRPRRLDIPLVEASDLDSRWGLEFRSGIPEQVRQRLEDEGFVIQSKRRYAPVWIDNGQPMLFPVEDTQIVPVSRPVY